MTTLRTITDPERFRTTYYGGRRYIDPLPADDRWEPTGTKEKLWNCTGIAKAVEDGQFWKKLDDSNKAPLDAVRVADYVNANWDRLADTPADERRTAMAMAAPRDLSRAANRGTAVHALIEALLRGETPLILEADAEPYQAIAEQVAADIAGTVDTMEAVGFGRRDDLPVTWGGTYDALHSDGSLLVDYKSRGADSQHGCYPKEVVQLGLGALCDYYIGTDEHGEAVRIEMPQFTDLALISIKPDSYEVFPVDVTEAKEAALQALEAHAAQKAGQKRARSAIGNPRHQISAGTAASGPADAGGPSSPSVTPPVSASLDWFNARYDEVIDAAGRETVKAAWPPELPTPKHRDTWTAAELEQACALIQRLHDDAGLTFPEPNPAAAKLRRKPKDSGKPATDDQKAALRARFDTLDAAGKTAVLEWQGEGTEATRRWIPNNKDKATRWTCAVNAAAVGIASHTTDTEIARGWIALVIGEDDTGTHPVGALLGSLTTTEAEQLASLTSEDTFAAAVEAAA